MTALHTTVDVFGAVAVAATFMSAMWVAISWVGWRVRRASARRSHTHLVAVPDHPCRHRPPAVSVRHGSDGGAA